MSNIYLEHMKEHVDEYGIDKMQFTDTETALLAIAVELQTLNKTLNKVVYRNNEGDWFINTEARPSYED